MHLKADSTVPSLLPMMLQNAVTCSVATTMKPSVTRNLLEHVAFIFIPKDTKVYYISGTEQALHLPVNETPLGWNTADV